LSSQIAGKQHDIQAEETTKSREGGPGATQAGTCWYPEPPFPKQRQPKPGRTRSRANVRCALLPRSGKLTDKVAIVTTEKAADFRSRTPTTHPAQPEEIAPAYVFLAPSHLLEFHHQRILPTIDKRRKKHEVRPLFL
jgi:hypothetical protein